MKTVITDRSALQEDCELHEPLREIRKHKRLCLMSFKVYLTPAMYEKVSWEIF